MKYAIGALLIGLGTLVLFVFWNNGSEETTLQSNNNPVTVSQDDSQASSDASTTSAAEGRYVPFDSASFEDDNNQRVLFFHAEWCSVCRFFDNEINGAPVPDGVSIYKVDFDESDALKDQYDVTVQATFVEVDAEGNVVRSWPFAAELNDIEDLYTALAKDE